MNQLSHSFREYAISDIKTWFDSGDLVIQPKYQRRRTAWPQTAKTNLIDTIVNNYPIPPIYLREFSTDSRERRREIIDGQQRITTIIEFLNGHFKLSHNYFEEEYIGYKFSDLPLELQNQILNYDLLFVAIKGATDADIISIFSRINSFSLPLNIQEKRNAQYAGEFKSFIYKLSSTYYIFWRENKIFSDNGIARMQDALFVSEIIATLKFGFDTNLASKINFLYKNFDLNFPESGYYSEIFNTMMTIIGQLFEDKKIANHFNKPSWFFTIFISLYEIFYGKVGKQQKSELNKINLRSLQNIKEELIRIIEQYNSNNISPEIRLLFQQGTGSSSNRKNRCEFLLSNLVRYVQHKKTS